jgi:hypothetical protein
MIGGSLDMLRTQPNVTRKATDPARPTFFDELVIRNGDPAVLGRFFLEAETALIQAGITVRRVDLKTLNETYKANADTWPIIGPPFNIHDSGLTDEGAACLIGYDERGRAVVSCAARHYDLGEQSLVEALRDLWFFYGDKAEALRGKIALDLAVPEAEKIRGRVIYLGGLWVHPEYRHAKLCVVFSLLTRAFALSQWEFEHEVLCGRGRLGDPDVIAMYRFAHCKESFSITADKKIAFEGKFIWTPSNNVAGIFTSGAASSDVAAASSRSRRGEELARA